ncbi:Alpha-1-6-mannosyltransferase subunit (Ecm39) [Penicillium waksmanii]|uniref:Alpha-1-6-mannosyltransferase subunit (Ecm39) n=1 Tax=Penicillium waksmanii TaxID=69791 RepID=UPI0025469998|nr:Alpha-1-6-mannosyltransferase subunit (Ecm39) [Penicillium waksmanii]KAJ5976043.1 Alpha-1-6-mannosyltransferase subunit (Ecm39) [Penicillium waksmanii]
MRNGKSARLRAAMHQFPSRANSILVFYLAGLLVPVLILLHLLVAPYTKVEESFHVQAIHDISNHGLPGFTPKFDLKYDHFAFPGAVPRSAVGALILAKLSQPFAALSKGIDRQILARAILGIYNAGSLIYFAHGLRRGFGQTVAIWYLVFQASQFHVIYYASRPLSNMFAFGMTTIASRLLLPDYTIPRVDARRRARLSLILVAIAGIVFRSELALLVATQTIFLLAMDRIRFMQDAVLAGVVSLFVGLQLTMGIDSIFWNRVPLWPELDAFLFNVISGQSSEWGTSPWYFYFLNALPRLLLNPLTYLLAIPVAIRQPATRQPSISLLTPTLAFVALYSIQPHKEWRFIIYIIPSLTAVAALGASYLWNRRSRSLFASLSSRLLVLSSLAALLLSNFVLLPASAANYPGAHALNALHNRHALSVSDELDGASVYLGNLACQTGVTRFLQQSPGLGWHYDKTEDKALKSSHAFWNQFDYVIVEASSDAEYKDNDETRLRRVLQESEWETTDIIDGFAGISIVKPSSPANGAAERRLLSKLGGESAAGLYDQARDSVRKVFLRGWWVELKMRPKLKVLKRIREE